VAEVSNVTVQINPASALVIAKATMIAGAGSLSSCIAGFHQP
jgi:hypothetical protein